LAQDANSVIGGASKAMGADKLTTIQYFGSGYDFAMGQAYSPTSPWPKFIVKTYARSIDFRVPASREDRVRLQFENPPRGGGLQPVIGERRQNQTIVVKDNTPWAQQLEIWMTPHGFLKAAAANHAAVKPQTVAGKKYTVVTFTGQNKAAVNGYLNEQNMVERVETRIDNPMLGDMPFTVVYTDYKDFGGVKFPTHIVQNQGGHPVLDLTVTDVKTNVANAALTAPDAVKSAKAPPVVAASQKLADGVWFIGGGSHNSVAIEMKDYMIVVETPLNDGRSVPVLAQVKQLVPGKPIRYVINSHTHFDHSGGLRAAVAEGAIIITHAQNKPYFERAFAVKNTINPDQLAKSGKKASFKVVDEKMVLTDGMRSVELYHVADSHHSDTFLMVYLPKEKLLIEADAFTPGPPISPPATPPNALNVNLIDNIERLNLAVDRILPLHGRIVPAAELYRVAGRAR
jgi:glyoxylase-like metal-dependent hydrolase (beta-lactamase superfamily II)